MPDQQTSPPPQKASARRAAVLNAARAAFLGLGYAASLDVIAQDAGVARRTIFYMFGSKEKLFREIVEQMSAEAMPQLVLDREQDMVAALLNFAVRYVALVTSPEVVAIQSLLLSGAPGFLEQMKAVIKRNNRELAAELTEYFKAKIKHRQMRVVPPHHAAERFLASVLGFARLQMMHGATPPRDGREDYIREAVAGFLDGVRPRPDGK